MPHDHEFPEDCDGHDHPCPDPDRDQPALTDVLDVIDGVKLTDGIAGNPITPFVLKPSASKIEIGGTKYSYSLVGDGIAFSIGAASHTIEWGHHDSGTRWHTHRASFDGGDLVTLTDP